MTLLPTIWPLVSWEPWGDPRPNELVGSFTDTIVVPFIVLKYILMCCVSIVSMFSVFYQAFAILAPRAVCMQSLPVTHSKFAMVKRLQTNLLLTPIEAGADDLKCLQWRTRRWLLGRGIHLIHPLECTQSCSHRSGFHSLYLSCLSGGWPETSAEFQRLTSCYGLKVYFYDLFGIWFIVESAGAA